MALRVGFAGVAHMHWGSYAHWIGASGRAEVVGAFEPNPERGQSFQRMVERPVFDRLEALIDASDLVIVTSENVHHAAYGVPALQAGKFVLCEKPLAISAADGRALLEAASAGRLMTAFPCPFSPIFQRLLARVQAGDIGPLQAICGTNRGKCPFDWFVQPELSGGGAMIDHVVHLADLIRRLFGSEPTSVHAVTSHNLYGQAWDDSALVTLGYADGRFATIDSSWSRPAAFPTWGDVALNVVGEKGTLEADLIAQDLSFYRERHASLFFGSDMDRRLVGHVLDVAEGRAEPIVTGEDGWAAAQVALRAYESLAASGVV